jgi:hypothetical protein
MVRWGEWWSGDRELQVLVYGITVCMYCMRIATHVKWLILTCITLMEQSNSANDKTTAGVRKCRTSSAVRIHTAPAMMKGQRLPEGSIDVMLRSEYIYQPVAAQWYLVRNSKYQISNIKYQIYQISNTESTYQIS